MQKEILDKLHKAELEILDEIVRVCKKNEIRYMLIGGTLLGATRHKGFIPWDDDIDVAMPREDFENFIKIANQELNKKYMLDAYNNNNKYWQPFAKVRIKNTVYQEKLVDDKENQKGIWLDIFPLDYTKKENSFILKLQWRIILILRKLNLNKINNKNKNIIKKLLKKITNIKFNTKLMTNIMKIQNGGCKKYFVNFGSQYGIKRQTHLIDKYIPLGELEFENKRYSVPNDYNYVLTKIYGKNYMELPPIEKRVTHDPIKIIFEDGQEVIFNKGDK